jgi:hypothetical protein
MQANNFSTRPNSQTIEYRLSSSYFVSNYSACHRSIERIYKRGLETYSRCILLRSHRTGFCHDTVFDALLSVAGKKLYFDLREAMIIVFTQCLLRLGPDAMS